MGPPLFRTLTRIVWCTSPSRRYTRRETGTTRRAPVKLMGIRFCHVGESNEAAALAEMMRKLGLVERTPDVHAPADFAGAIFPAEGEDSWLEIWPAGEGMPPGTMLQLVVEDADAVADRARINGLEPQGPIDAHGERIYYLAGPGGTPISFQSPLA